MEEQVLLFHFPDQKQQEAILTILFLMQIKGKVVERKNYQNRLIDLIQNSFPAPVYLGKELDGQMLVFAGIKGERLDQLLSLLRSNPICGVIPYKAVLTEHNQSWNALTLFLELKREHEMMHRA